MANFNEAFEITNKHEGGYANVSGDKGGETYKGIARNYWPNWAGWGIIDSAKEKTPMNRLNGVLSENFELQKAVSLFYKINFWDKMRLDEFKTQAIANEVYDTGVNFGSKRSIKMLQEAVELTTQSELAIDGLIGRNTIRAENIHGNPEFLYKMLNVLQGEAYIEAWREDGSQEKFIRGWFTRVVFIND